MISPYYFIDESLKSGFKINLESHKNCNANSILTITPRKPDFGIEIIYLNKILKEITTYSRIINQQKFKYHILFSASFYKINEEDQRSDGPQFFINFNNNHNLTETDIDNIDVKCQLEHQNQNHETKESGWIFDKPNSMKKRVYKSA